MGFCGKSKRQNAHAIKVCKLSRFWAAFAGGRTSIFRQAFDYGEIGMFCPLQSIFCAEQLYLMDMILKCPNLTDMYMDITDTDMGALSFGLPNFGSESNSVAVVSHFGCVQAIHSIYVSLREYGLTR